MLGREGKKMDGMIYMNRKGKGMTTGYYNRNEWGIEAKEVISGREGFEEELVKRERDVQRQWKKGKIRNAKYNQRYKNWGAKTKVCTILFEAEKF